MASSSSIIVKSPRSTIHHLHSKRSIRYRVTQGCLRRLLLVSEWKGVDRLYKALFNDHARFPYWVCSLHKSWTYYDVVASTAFLAPWMGWQPARLERPCGPPAVQSPTAQVRNEDSLFCDVKGNYLYNHYTWGNSSPFLYFIHYVEDTFRRCFIVRLLPPALTEWLHPRFWRPTGLVQLV